jgi:hypothetical protein
LFALFQRYGLGSFRTAVPEQPYAARKDNSRQHNQYARSVWVNVAEMRHCSSLPGLGQPNALPFAGL